MWRRANVVIFFFLLFGAIKTVAQSENEEKEESKEETSVGETASEEPEKKGKKGRKENKKSKEEGGTQEDLDEINKKEMTPAAKKYIKSMEKAKKAKADKDKATRKMVNKKNTTR